MCPDRVSNPGTLTYESGALPTALRDPQSGNMLHCRLWQNITCSVKYFGQCMLLSVTNETKQA